MVCIVSQEYIDVAFSRAKGQFVLNFQNLDENAANVVAGFINHPLENHAPRAQITTTEGLYGGCTSTVSIYLDRAEIPALTQSLKENHIISEETPEAIAAKLDDAAKVTRQYRQPVRIVPEAVEPEENYLRKASIAHAVIGSHHTR